MPSVDPLSTDDHFVGRIRAGGEQAFEADPREEQPVVHRDRDTDLRTFRRCRDRSDAVHWCARPARHDRVIARTAWSATAKRAPA